MSPFWGKGMMWRKNIWQIFMQCAHARIWERKTAGRKSSGQKENVNAEEESAQGQHARRPN
jgi:hypothetical protein